MTAISDKLDKTYNFIFSPTIKEGEVIRSRKITPFEIFNTIILASGLIYGSYHFANLHYVDGACYYGAACFSIGLNGFSILKRHQRVKPLEKTQE